LPSDYHNFAIGRLGEAVAGRYLKGKGYKIIEKNYRCKQSEIDLVACFKQTLVFVEVRTKTGENFGSPEESLNKRKINKIVKACQFYMYQSGYFKGYRIDAICIVLGKNRIPRRLSHYKDIVF